MGAFGGVLMLLPWGRPLFDTRAAAAPQGPGVRGLISPRLDDVSPCLEYTFLLTAPPVIVETTHRFHDSTRVTNRSRRPAPPLPQGVAYGEAHSAHRRGP